MDFPFESLNTYSLVTGLPEDFAGDKILQCVCIGFGGTETGSSPETLAHTTTVNVSYGRSKCEGLA